MNTEITDLDMILNYLETTSLEPHDDYTSEFTYKDQKILYKYIKQLQEENKHLKDNWNKVKNIIEDERMSHWAPGPLFLTGLLISMEKIEKGDSNVKD